MYIPGNIVSSLKGNRYQGLQGCGVDTSTLHIGDRHGRYCAPRRGCCRMQGWSAGCFFCIWCVSYKCLAKRPFLPYGLLPYGLLPYGLLSSTCFLNFPPPIESSR